MKDQQTDDDPLFQQAVRDHAEYLGIDPNVHSKYLYIAEEALVAPLPADWERGESEEGVPYYFNTETGESMWAHPRDDEYRQKFRTLLEKDKQVAQSVTQARTPKSTAAATGFGKDSTSWLMDSDDSESEFSPKTKPEKSSSSKRVSQYSPRGKSKASSFHVDSISSDDDGDEEVKEIGLQQDKRREDKPITEIQDFINPVPSTKPAKTATSNLEIQDFTNHVSSTKSANAATSANGLAPQAVKTASSTPFSNTRNSGAEADIESLELKITELRQLEASQAAQHQQLLLTHADLLGQVKTLETQRSHDQVLQLELKTAHGAQVLKLEKELQESETKRRETEERLIKKEEASGLLMEELEKHKVDWQAQEAPNIQALEQRIESLTGEKEEWKTKMTQVQEQARIDEVERQKSSLEVQAQHALALEKSTLQHQNEIETYKAQLNQLQEKQTKLRQENERLASAPSAGHYQDQILALESQKLELMHKSTTLQHSLDSTKSQLAAVQVSSAEELATLYQKTSSIQILEQSVAEREKKFQVDQQLLMSDKVGTEQRLVQATSEVSVLQLQLKDQLEASAREIHALECQKSKSAYQIQRLTEQFEEAEKWRLREVERALSKESEILGLKEELGRVRTQLVNSEHSSQVAELKIDKSELQMELKSALTQVDDTATRAREDCLAMEHQLEHQQKEIQTKLSELAVVATARASSQWKERFELRLRHVQGEYQAFLKTEQDKRERDEREHRERLMEARHEVKQSAAESAFLKKELRRVEENHQSVVEQLQTLRRYLVTHHQGASRPAEPLNHPNSNWETPDSLASALRQVHANVNTLFQPTPAPTPTPTPGLFTEADPRPRYTTEPMTMHENHNSTIREENLDQEMKDLIQSASQITTKPTRKSSGGSNISRSGIYQTGYWKAKYGQS